MTATVYDFVSVNKDNIETIMTTIGATTTHLVIPIIQGNEVMFIKIS